jgi:hypothetical protein
MARWTGEPGIAAVLEAGDAWRDRCFLGTFSILTDRPLWTLENLADLAARYAKNPIEGKRDFLDKLKEQLDGAPPVTIQLAAEVLWFLHLFPGPSTLKAATKRDQITSVWSWSGDAVPASLYLDDAHLHGVGNPGTAYFTHRPAEYEYTVRTTIAFKSLPPAEQSRLMREDVPWLFVKWLDEQPGSDRRLIRGGFLYFLFPDYLERNLSKDHKQQIYNGFKSKLVPEDVVKSRTPSLAEYDRAISRIRAALVKERGTEEIDFYDDATKPLWFSTLRDASVKDFTSWMNTYLADRGLQLNQPGRDLKKLDEKRRIDPATGFWVEKTFVTSKPPRWLLHFDVTGEGVVARVPEEHRAGVIGYANTKGGDSGALAVRILPVFKVDSQEFREIERWEWMLFLCFPGGLEPGSSGEAFDNFDVATGELTYMKRHQAYIFGCLLCLNSPDEQLSLEVGRTSKIISYRDATDALGKLIHVAPLGGSDE